MKSKINQSHFKDADGNPAGGNTFGRGFAIGWQNGPLGKGESNGALRTEPNGAFVEDIIEAAAGRLRFYQESKFNCHYNYNALKHLEAASAALNDRTKDRLDRGVEGTHER